MTVLPKGAMRLAIVILATTVLSACSASMAQPSVKNGQMCDISKGEMSCCAGMSKAEMKKCNMPCCQGK